MGWELQAVLLTGVERRKVIPGVAAKARLNRPRFSCSEPAAAPLSWTEQR